MKIGLFFGSFNPIHIGFLLLGAFLNPGDMAQAEKRKKINTNLITIKKFIQQYVT